MGFWKKRRSKIKLKTNMADFFFFQNTTIENEM